MPNPIPSPVPLHSRVRISPHVLSRDLQGELVVLNLSNGTYFSLDPVGTRMWQALHAHESLQQALVTLLEEYDAEAARLEHDLRVLVSELCEHGLLELIPSVPA